jgi:hypothetical protein
MFCRLHGEVHNPVLRGGQSWFNSQCMKCSEATRGQFAKVGLVFVVIGACIALLGTMLALADIFPVGMIFIAQGVFFAIIGLVFRLMRSNSNSKY